MDKNHKKDIEQLLIKQTEKILLEIDASATAIFSKNIKSHCKDLAKKFLKTQKKFQKQMEVVAQKEIVVKQTVTKTAIKKLPVTKPVQQSVKVKTTIAKPIVATLSKKTPNKTAAKKTRKGNNLVNAATVQKKAKASLAKILTKTAK